MTVEMRQEGHVAFITLARPEAMNALNIEAMQALRAHLVTFRDDSNLRVCIVSGRGLKAFCAGADLKGTVAPSASYAQAQFAALEPAAEQGLYVRLMDLSDLNIWKPIVAAINGHCLGGGLELALQCDIRIASDNATFGLPEVAVASIPAVSGLHRLLKAIPAAHAMKMALTGKSIDAARAATIGLISDVCTPASLLPTAQDIAERIAANGPLAVQACKRLANQTAHLSYADAQQVTEMAWGILRDTADRQEGRQAFAGKRPPHYVGK